MPSKTLPRLEFLIESATLDVLHIPAGYVSSIQALEEKSKLVVMSDYHLGEINDEFRYTTDYFIIK
jgi:dTDP-4-dehydrorhamnose 3,5-epimerase-like enzyme